MCERHGENEKKRKERDCCVRTLRLRSSFRPTLLLFFPADVPHSARAARSILDLIRLRYCSALTRLAMTGHDQPRDVLLACCAMP